MPSSYEQRYARTLDRGHGTGAHKRGRAAGINTLPRQSFWFGACMRMFMIGVWNRIPIVYEPSHVKGVDHDTRCGMDNVERRVRRVPA